MALIKLTLKSGLQTDIENYLKVQFQKQAFINALKTYLDGGSLAGINSGAKDLKKALGNIKTKTSPIANNTPDITGAASLSEELVTRITANEMANGIAEGLCAWLADDFAREVAKHIATAVADNVDTYIKSATIIVPPGQAVATATGAGATSSPSPPANIT